MAYVYSFEEAKKTKEFNASLTKRRNDFYEVYERIIAIEFQLSKKRLGELDSYYPSNEQSSSSVFGTEENMRTFYESVMWSLGIHELPLSELTFSNYAEFGDITHELAILLFQREADFKSKGVYQEHQTKSISKMKN